MKTRVWIQAFRLKFLPQGVAPVFIGSAVAYRARGVFSIELFLLVFLGMMLVQFGLTMLDDWHDFMSGTDTSSTAEKNPYTGGSGVLVDGSIKPREMIAMVGLFYLAALVIGLWLTYLRGLTVFYIMLAGFFISIFYSIPPFQFASRGLGEFMMLLGYGPTITLGAYFVQAQELTGQAFLAGLLPGMLMWTMIIINEIPDYEEDKSSGKRNLVVRLGKEGGVWLFIFGLSSIYLYITLLALRGYFPMATFIAVLSIFFALKGVRHLMKNFQDKLAVSAANRHMVWVYSSTTLLFTVGFLI
jgi:1,4-dihydroxy-2-naphthoate octaprenyltransferase